MLEAFLNTLVLFAMPNSVVTMIKTSRGTCGSCQIFKSLFSYSTEDVTFAFRTVKFCPNLALVEILLLYSFLNHRNLLKRHNQTVVVTIHTSTRSSQYPHERLPVRVSSNTQHKQLPIASPPKNTPAVTRPPASLPHSTRFKLNH